MPAPLLTGCLLALLVLLPLLLCTSAYLLLALLLIYLLKLPEQEKGERKHLPLGHGHAGIPSPSLHPLGIWGMHAYVLEVFFKVLGPGLEP